MEREKLAEKENMGKEDCESYFKSNSKQKIVQKTDLSDKNEYRGKLLQRLNIKIEKTWVSNDMIEVLFPFLILLTAHTIISDCI